MPYTVTAGRAGDPRVPDRALVKCETVEEALNQACTFLAVGMVGVRIINANGGHIDGRDLESCCRGEKVLAKDLSVA
jgi:hypothetical protein